MAKDKIDPNKAQEWQKLIITIVTAIIGFLTGIGAHATTILTGIIH